MDMSTLKPANENPWYLMMTLYGEQEGDEIDWGLAEKNRRLWNMWMCQGMPVEKLTEIARKCRLSVNELQSTQSQLDDIEGRFAERASHSKFPVQMPSRSERIELKKILFSHVFVLSKAYVGSISLNGSVFERTACFNRTVFGGRTSFKYARFDGHVAFNRAYFLDKSSFTRTVFEERTDFRRAVFDAQVSFKGVKSPSNVDTPAYFGKETLFSEAHFHKRADFYYRRFGPSQERAEVLTFANAVFEGPVSFEEARFPHLMPVLSNTTLPLSTKVTAEESHWSAVRGPLNFVTGKMSFRTRQDDVKAKESAGALRHAMARQMLPEEEHFFFRREMHHAARAEPFWRTGHIYIFEALSDFGYSIARPANSLLILWLFAAAVYFETTAFGIGKSLGYSFANMFKFFGLHRTYFDFDKIQDWPGWLQWFSGAQTVLGFILLFFLGLGLRTRFRLR